VSREYADVILTSINSPLLGQRRLDDAAKLTVTQEATRTPVKTMNRRRTARGFRSGTKTYTAQLQVEIQLTPEVDWSLLFQTSDQFLLTYELGDGGNRWQLADCIISNISTEGDEDGGLQMTVDLLALDHRLEP
jgi:hypothetical protein